jgi:hypothetical protein
MMWVLDFPLQRDYYINYVILKDVLEEKLMPYLLGSGYGQVPNGTCSL